MPWHKLKGDTGNPVMADYYLVRFSYKSQPMVAFYSMTRGWVSGGVKLLGVVEWIEIPN